MVPFTDKAVERVFDSYPAAIGERMLALRDLIFTTGEGLGIEQELTETLKWGEPSYTCPNGSTLRLNWKQNDSKHFRLCFHCQTKLISTFRDLYPKDFEFEGNRAIRLELNCDPDLRKLAACIEMSLTYHLIKHLPSLGQL